MDREEMREDHIVMLGGTVMMMKNGEMQPMDEEITMPDGTKIRMDGTMLMPDGTVRMMAEGETMPIQAEGAPANPEDIGDRQFTEAMEDEELRDQLH
jgi:hypothetical protein